MDTTLLIALRMLERVVAVMIGGLSIYLEYISPPAGQFATGNKARRALTVTGLPTSRIRTEASRAPGGSERAM